ncbi:unnamed protein product [Cuscuta epithymum]|uniref:Enhancer of polycomb-like protein n=1 Tax=Cuscuta epithymum TaxID=186058 RepID=A0AAV0DRD9_9ASTE|nr:unnamed protein product [Cuscuta epithymum]
MSAEKLGGLVNLKKKRSLDLLTLYQPEVDNKRRSNSKGKRKEEKEGNEVKKKRKREALNVVASARLDQVEKKSSRADEEGANGLDMQQSIQSYEGPVSSWNGISYCLLGENGDPVRIPKRPRNIFCHKNSQTQPGSQSLRLLGSVNSIKNSHDEAEVSDDFYLPKQPTSSGSNASGGDRMAKSSKAPTCSVVSDNPKPKVGINHRKGRKNAQLPKKPSLLVNEPSGDDVLAKLGKHVVGDAVNKKLKMKMGVVESIGHKNAHLPKKPGLSANELSADDDMSKLGKHFVGNTVNEKLKQKVGVNEFKERKNSKLQKKLSLSGNEASAADQIVKLGKVSAGNAINGKYKRKGVANESKGSTNAKATSAQHSMVEVEELDKNADISSRKWRKSHRKKKGLQSGGIDSVKHVEPPEDVASHYSDDLQDDDDEENLEQNAARMLSSRFDPRCTGFATSCKSSALSYSNQLSSLISSPKDLTTQDANSLASSEAASKDYKEKSVPRKRRHFYEVHLKDLDAYKVLNKRVQVFSPLEETWCCGILKAYDQDKRLHQVKYDGQDDVWINLEDQRFKLLLFPGELPGKDKSRRSSKASTIVCKDKLDVDVDEDSHSGSYLESEPIISWLAHRIKYSSRTSKKHKTSEESSIILSSQSHDQTEDTKDNIGFSDTYGKKSEHVHELQNIETDVGKNEESLIESDSMSQNKVTVVYVRRRFRKKPECVPELILLGSHNDTLLWSLDDEGMLSLSLPFIESKQLTYGIHLPALSFIQHGAEYIQLSRIVSLLQYGAIVTKWPEVTLEMLFVDSSVGLRFLLFECCLKDAMVITFLVMSLFSKPDEHLDLEDTQLPVTSVCFKFSRVQDLKKQRSFVFYRFSKLETSKWLYLDSKLQYRSLMAKCLSLSECTYDNIKSLECPSSPFSTHNRPENLQNKCVPCGLAMGISKESYLVRMCHPTSTSNSKLGHIQFSLSFAAVPALFFSLHLHLLMEQNFADVGLQNHKPSCCSLFSSGITCQHVIHDASQGKKFHGNVPETTLKSNVESLLPLATSNDIEGLEKNNSTDRKGLAKNASSLVLSQMKICTSDQRSYPVVDFPHPDLDHINIEIPSPDQVDQPSDGRGLFSGFPSSYSFHDNQNMLLSSPVGELSPVWSDGKMGFMRTGFASGPKKPRTQVHYTLPSGSYEVGLRNRNQGQKTLPYKRIRRASEKKILYGGCSSERNFELFGCDANVLVTVGDKGWRENDARVVLEVADHNECRLAVKFSGTTKYSYKVHNILQPGSTNRFTHAMMWKGGKDWVLEFPDRSQWILFKEMYEECHNRNIRAALVKNIPIPGVRLIEEREDDATSTPFTRNFTNYFRQVESDIEMAMNTSQILYDMDSEDECWLSANQTSSKSRGYDEISDELFEKTMNLLEKVAYTEQRENFTSEELGEFMAEVGFMEVVKSVYEHWKLKRQKSGMPLLRHFQRPLWERYQRQVKDWEQHVSRAIAANHVKAPPIEKPPMFAFCLKPRGLETPNRGSKQRSQKRISVPGHNHSALRDQDGFHAFGKRMNGYAFGDEMDVYTGNNHEQPLEASSPCDASRRAFSPCDASGYISLSNDGFEWNPHPKFQRNKSKRIGTFVPAGNPHLVSSHDRRTTKRNGFHPPEWPSPKLYQQFDTPNVPELRLRDASCAAKHACHVAKQKREKAHRLLYVADVAIQKAVVALMKVDAMEAFAND